MIIRIIYIRELKKNNKKEMTDNVSSANEAEKKKKKKKNSIKTQVVNISGNELPVYKCKGDAGMDVRAYIPDSDSVILKPMQRMLIRTGLFVKIPKGFEIEVRSRSGLAINKGIIVLNSPGTIDCGYRDEVCVILINLSTEDFKISTGDRIAQFVFKKVTKNKWEPVDKLSTDDDEDRGGGIGHTGIK